MEFKESLHEGECSVTLTGELTIKQVSPLYRQFAPLLGNDSVKSISVDLAGVYETDTAGIQLLMALKTYCSQLNIRFMLTNHSLTVLKIMDLYGLAVFFRDKMVISREHREQLSFRYGIK